MMILNKRTKAMEILASQLIPVILMMEMVNLMMIILKTQGMALKMMINKMKQIQMMNILMEMMVVLVLLQPVLKFRDYSKMSFLI